jgi:hypothetical protein
MCEESTSEPLSRRQGVNESADMLGARPSDASTHSRFFLGIKLPDLKDRQREEVLDMRGI